MEKIKIIADAREVVEVEVNEFGDTIAIVTNDAGFLTKFSDLVQWIDKKADWINEKEKELNTKYGSRPIVSGDNVDVEQIVDITNLQVEFCKEVIERFEVLFGQNIIHKYFKKVYSFLPDYVPDTDALSEFIDKIIPVVNSLYNSKIEYRKERSKRFAKYQPQDHKRKGGL